MTAHGVRFHLKGCALRTISLVWIAKENPTTGSDSLAFICQHQSDPSESFLSATLFWGCFFSQPTCIVLDSCVSVLWATDHLHLRTWMLKGRIWNFSSKLSFFPRLSSRSSTRYRLLMSLPPLIFLGVYPTRSESPDSGCGLLWRRCRLDNRVALGSSFPLIFAV